jgi:hypothetical protein
MQLTVHHIYNSDSYNVLNEGYNLEYRNPFYLTLIAVCHVCGTNLIV